jgi:thioesterase domain-containing protein
MVLPPQLVRFREGAATKSVVLLPGLGGEATEMMLLASKVRGGGAVYALDLMRLVDEQGSDLSVEGLALACSQVIEAAGGVDVVAGYSFGGLVAAEMSRTAERDVRTVLIDAMPDQTQWPREMWLASIWLRILKHGRNLLGMSPSSALEEFTRRMGGFLRRIRRRRQAAQPPKMAQGDADHAPMRMFDALLRYKPQTFEQRLTLIEGSIPSFAMPASRIWRLFAPRLEVRQYEGEHLDVLTDEKATQGIADHISEVLGL